MTWYKSPANKWRTLRSLSAPERRLLWQAVYLLPLARLALRTCGFRWTADLLLRLDAVRPMPRLTHEEAMTWSARAVRQVTRAARNGLGSSNCLRESLVLWWLLRRRGVECELRVGVRRAAARFEAHAWVEWSGLPLTAGAADFIPFSRPLLSTPMAGA